MGRGTESQMALSGGRSRSPVAGRCDADTCGRRENLVERRCPMKRTPTFGRGGQPGGRSQGGQRQTINQRRVARAAWFAAEALENRRLLSIAGDLDPTFGGGDGVATAPAGLEFQLATTFLPSGFLAA